MASHGTRVLDPLTDSGMAASGMRLRKLRLIVPIIALKQNKTANCHGLGSPKRQAAAITNVTKLHAFCTAASRARYFPRKLGGTSNVIHGNQAPLEIPRERLKQKSNTIINASRFFASRKLLVNGTKAIAKMNATRVPHPAYTKRLNPTRSM